METLLILAAVAVAGLALALAAVMSAQARRPPLRTRSEENLAEGDEEFLIRSLSPAPRSPIDRSAPIAEAEWSDARTDDAKSIESEMEAKLIEAKPSEAASEAGRDTSERPAGHGAR